MVVPMAMVVQQVEAVAMGAVVAGAVATVVVWAGPRGACTELLAPRQLRNARPRLAYRPHPDRSRLRW